MRFLGNILLILLGLMSLAAGSAKVMQSEQEVEFFQAANIEILWLMPFGIVQIIGAILLLPAKTRKAGLMIIAVAFLISALMIFVTGDVKFGLIAILPAAIALCLFLRIRNAQ